MNSWGEPYDRVLSTPKRDWEDYHVPYCDFQAGYFQCKNILEKRYSHELETFYLYCSECASAYPVLAVS